MFAHGGSSSRTSPRLDSDQSRLMSPGSKSPVKANVYGTTRGPVASDFPPSRSALRRASGRIPSADTSACARARVAPGASRPKTTPSGPVLRSIPSAVRRSGTQYRKLNGNWKPSGMTPTTVCTSPPSRSSRPMTSREPAKRRCQTSWPMTTTGAAPGAASASAIGRPTSGATLATRKPAAEISATAASSTDPSDVMMLRRVVWNAPTSSTECRVARQRSTSCHVVSRRRPASRSHTWMATTRSPSSSGSRLHMTTSNAANTIAAMPIARVVASPPTSVSPQFLTSRRSPSLTSSHDEPSQGSPRCSRSASTAWLWPPAAARASRAASRGAWPFRRSSSSARARCPASSRCRSWSVRRPPNAPQTRRVHSRSEERTSWSVKPDPRRACA
jgi:hypothetical protein